MTLSKSVDITVFTVFFLIAGFMSAIISNVKIPAICMMAVVLTYATIYKISFKYYIICAVLLNLSAILALGNSLGTIFYSSYLISFVLLYYVGIKHFDLNAIFNSKTFLMTVEICFICTCIILTICYFLGIDTNSLLPTGSRNSLGAIITVISSVRFLVAKRYNTLLLCLSGLLVILLGGRTNEAVGAALILFAIWVQFRSFQMNLLLVAMFIALLIYVDVTIGFVNIFDIVFVNDAGKSIGLQTLRTRVWFEWYQNINVLKLLFGFDLNELYFTGWKLNGNPHNSYILLHSYTGLLSILFIGWFLYKACTANIKVLFFVAIMLFKAFFDSILFPSSLDLFLLIYLFWGQYEKARSI